MILEKIKKTIRNIHDWLIYEEDQLAHVHLFKRAFVPHRVNNYQPHATRHHVIASVIVCIFVFKIFVISLLIPVHSVYAGGISATDLVKMTNIAREQNHLPLVKQNESLVNAAHMKAENMFEEQYWSHDSPDGVSPWHWFDEVGYVYKYAGENLAMDWSSTEGVFKGWQDSRTHWENIVNPDYREVGIAVVPGVFEGKQTTIVVQLFGTPLVKEYRIQPAVNLNEENGSGKAEEQNIEEQNTEVDILDDQLNIGNNEINLNRPSIEEPMNDSYVNTPDFLIRGKADSKVVINILDDELKVGKVPTDDEGYFSYRTADFYDGLHLLHAYSQDTGEKSEKSDIVKVVVDTQSPIIVEGSIDTEYSDEETYGYLKISVMVLDNPEFVEFISMNQRVKGSKSGPDMFEVDMIFEDDEYNLESYPITIYAVDKAKNTAIFETEYRMENTGDGSQKTGGTEAQRDKGDEVKEETKSNEEESEEKNWEEIEGVSNLEDDVIIEDTLSDEGIIVDEENINDEVINEEEQEDNSEILGISDNDSYLQSSGESYLISEEQVASNDMTSIIFWTKIAIFSICGFFFLAFLMQAYIIHHRGIHDKKYHPIFHATGLLCIMLVIIIM